MEYTHLITYNNKGNDNKFCQLISIDNDLSSKLKIVLSNLELTDCYDLNVALAHYKFNNGKSNNSILEVYKERIYDSFELHEVVNYDNLTQICTYKTNSSITPNTVKIDDLDIIRKSIDYIIRELNDVEDESNLIELKYIYPELVLKDGYTGTHVSININELIKYHNLVSFEYNRRYETYNMLFENDTLENIFNLLFHGSGYKYKSHDKSHAILTKNSIDYELPFKDSFLNIYNIYFINEYTTFIHNFGYPRYRRTHGLDIPNIIR